MSDQSKHVFRARGLARAAEEDQAPTDDQLLNEVEDALGALANLTVAHSKPRMELRLAAFRRLRYRATGGAR